MMMKNLFIAAIVVMLLVALFSGSATAMMVEDDLMLDGGANPSLCTCACECQRPRGADLLKENGVEVKTTLTTPVKINNVA
jgi:hypothetical protein